MMAGMLRRLLLVGVSLAGFAAAGAVATALVQLRYRWIDPAEAQASGGMYAFGDLILWLAVVGVLSLPPTWLLFRALRDVEWVWRLASWSGLIWAALAPAGVLVRLADALRGPAFAVAPLPVFQVADALSLLRLLASPASLPGLAVAWWACGHPPSRRRLRWAVALEASGVAAYAIWVVWALARTGR
jgi:hypothetical protein